jgi:hypothetical protein
VNRLISITGIALAAGFFSLSAVAGNNGNGNGAPSGPHFNLNIIGVENPKKSTMTGSNRHTIFMPLQTAGKGVKSVVYVENPDGSISKIAGMEIEGQIWLMPGEDFRVCDGNGFDLAYGCDDNELGDWNTCAYIETAPDVWEYQCGVISKKYGATFELPCNMNITGDAYDSDGDGVPDTTLDGLVSCTQGITADGDIVDLDPADYPPRASYQVWARALGKIDGGATITTCATVMDELQCSLENAVLTRTRGKQYFADVTDELTSLVAYVCVERDPDTDDCIDVDVVRIALFAGGTYDWFWNYANDGLRLAQLRFYYLDDIKP